MTEWLLVSIPLISALLWRLGGAGTPPLKKAWRRYALPALTTILLCLLGVQWWRAILAALLTVGVNSLGYGDGKSILYKLMVSVALGAPAMVIHLSAWFGCVLTLFCFGGSLALSRRFSWWTHALVEISGGFSQGLALALAVQLRAG